MEYKILFITLHCKPKTIKVMREFLMNFLFGDSRRSMVMLCAILIDYFMFNLLKY